MDSLRSLRLYYVLDQAKRILSFVQIVSYQIFNVVIAKEFAVHGQYFFRFQPFVISYFSYAVNGFAVFEVDIIFSPPPKITRKA